MTASPVKLILSETRLRRFRPFGASVQPRAGISLVVATNGGDVRVVPDRRTLGELAFAPHSTQYEVDVAHHSSSFTFELKSDNDGYAFTAAVEVTWRVHDAAQVVRQGIQDGTDIVRQQIRGRMLRLSRRYDIEKSLDLETAIQAEFESSKGRLLDECLWVHSFAVEITLDEAGQEWLRTRRTAIRDRILIQETHDVEVEKQRQAQELEQLQAEAEVAREEIRQASALKTKRLEQEQELDRLQREKQQELDAEQQRAKLFMEAMERGDAAVLATHLGRTPDDAKDVVRMIIENKAVAEERQAKLLAEMIDKGMILPADMEGVNTELIRTVMGLVSKQSAGVFSLTKILDVPMAELTQRSADVVLQPDDAHDDESDDSSRTSTDRDEVHND
ncbi:hypothetical protein AB0J90_29660 [Micromonospora sp. NPDC049523]|uniref:hypothetical protein n=1 Tax=Micromonospora sp. NPDC049523 TaxID=3155921 RepID=UPI00341E1694